MITIVGTEKTMIVTFNHHIIFLYNFDKHNVTN